MRRGGRAWIFLIGVIVVFQVSGAAFFLYDITSALLGLPPIPWTLYEILEIIATICLITGSALGGIALRTNLPSKSKG